VAVIVRPRITDVACFSGSAHFKDEPQIDGWASSAQVKNVVGCDQQLSNGHAKNSAIPLHHPDFE
jgi:hypothetical protein